jgi:ammonia channel protein AmtB
MGFLDHGGASIVHIMGGLAGFMGTYLIGPRVGLFAQDTKLAYVLDDLCLEDDNYNNSDDDLVMNQSVGQTTKNTSLNSNATNDPRKSTPPKPVKQKKE